MFLNAFTDLNVANRALTNTNKTTAKQRLLRILPDALVM